MRIPPAIAPAWPALLGCLLSAPAALAADGEGARLDLPADGTPTPSAGSAAAGASSGIVRTIVGLAVVLGVIYGLHWVLKQVKASREATSSGPGLATLATLPLGPNRALHLVRAGDEVVLVGSGEAGVSALRTYSEDEARALGLLEEPEGPSEDGGGGGLMAELKRRTVIR